MPKYEACSTPPERYVEIRAQLLDTYEGKNLDGLDIDRVDGFFAAHDIVPKPYIVVTPSDVGDFKEIDSLGLFHLGSESHTGDFVKGQYTPELGIFAVFRDAAHEELNGVENTEGTLVHEGTHSDCEGQDLIQHEAGYYFVPRVGYMLTERPGAAGHWLEEGWADLHRGMYLAENFEDGSMVRIAEQSDWKDGPDDMAPIGMIIGDEIKNVVLPFKYIENGNGVVYLTDGALPAFALELLIDLEPEIYPAMRHARRGIKQMRYLKNKLDSVSPDLYRRLRGVDSGSDGSFEFLETVVGDMFGSMSSMPTDPLRKSSR